MNIVRHRVYKLELDIWEPLGQQAEKELDQFMRLFRTGLPHCGNVKIRMESEERV